MQGLVTQPGVAGSTRVADVPDARPQAGEVLLRVLEVGVCGTDREISAGVFGVPPDDAPELVLGHELLGVVAGDGHGFSRGDLVTATVRRSCGRCLACEEGSPDSCLTGDYSERGITRLHGFARELVAEDAAQLVPIPRSLGRLGVLAEPTSICERAIRHARTIGGRQPWELERALVVDPSRLSPNVVTLYAAVRVRDLESGHPQELTLVSPSEANVSAGRISVLAPLGTALLGYRQGDVVEWVMPGGLRRLLIEEVRQQPATDADAAMPGAASVH